MQPFQCDLQPQLQEPHRTTHTGTTTRCKTHRRNKSRMKRPQPHPPHRRGTFHRRLQPLYTEKHKVSCSGFLPKTLPMQHSCSHSNAICNHSFKNRIELRTQEQPFLLHIWSTTLPQGQFHCFLFFCDVLIYVLLYDLPPFLKVNFIASYSFVMYWYIMYCYMIYHPSSRSISLLLILLWCIDTLCIVTWSTTLHQGQFHCFLFFCDVLIHYVLLHDLPPFIIVKVIRNSEVLTSQLPLMKLSVASHLTSAKNHHCWIDE